MKIFKYTLSKPDRVEATSYIEIPIGYRLLDVQLQHGAIVAWAAVNPDARPQRLKVDLKPTGGDIDLNDIQFHVKTLAELSGVFIWHVFIRPA